MTRRHWDRLPASWVVGLVIERAQLSYGDYQWSDWESFYLACGLAWVIVSMPAPLSAFMWGQTVYLRRELDARARAAAAWHEAGHHLLHAGSCAYWLGRPQGTVTVAKFERQARQFADWFPVWGED